MKQLTLYDLPCILFQLYADELKLEIKEATFWLTENVLIKCKYILLPLDNITLTLFLIDNRCIDLPDDRYHVELILFPNESVFLEQGVVIDQLERSGSILVRSSSYKSTTEINKESGFRFWLSAKIIQKSEIQLSFRSWKSAKIIFFGIAERAQELCGGKEYEWINSYFRANGSGKVTPLEVNAMLL